jgi:hypothetical protein
MTTTTQTRPGAALVSALDKLSYDFLVTNAPELIPAIERALTDGLTPQGVRFIVQREVGSLREGIALRCEQAARYLAGQREAA